ncbi:MAG: protein kinase, partial [Candidatus Krumholzibacteriota bacterium]|nr:protein kinase [Candidatus Krumholzibacteriota bacterium]
MIGRTLNGRYRVERKIGKGRFADVYRGMDLKLKRHVAIKVLHEPGEDSERRNFKERFLCEAEILARLDHANVITVYDYADDDGPLYLVMELVEGPTLLELTNQASLIMPQICSIGWQICSAMSY